MNLFTIAEESLGRFGEKAFLVFEGQTLTNARLVSEAERLARLLAQQGIRPGDHVVLLLPNGLEIFLVFLALARLGGVAVPVGPRLTEPELAAIAGDSESGWILSLGDPARRAVRSCSHLGVKIVEVGELLAAGGRGADIPDRGGREEDLAYIVYTSGTQGQPKGVMLTHGNIMAEGRGVAEAFSVPGEDPSELSQLLVLPLSHSYGLMVMGMTYFLGNKTVVLPQYRTEAVLETIRKHQIRLMWAVPTMYALMLAHSQAPDYLKSVVHWDSGGAPLPVVNHRAIEERFGGTVTDGYGCTEASGCVTTQTRKKYSPPGSQGFVIQGDRLEVVDEQGRVLPDGQAGEFLISGATVMRGYWKKPDLTADRLKEGKYLSGDWGLRHPDGYYIFLERKDDLIIRGGENIYPREVENQLYQHPEVREAAVKGVPDPIMGQELKAFLALHPGSTLDENQIRRFLAERLAGYKVPRYIEIRPELPKSSHGKILRRRLPD
ncbi:MAG: AMP-binding protein [Thermodesulfobacteriota bacterium]